MSSETAVAVGAERRAHQRKRLESTLQLRPRHSDAVVSCSTVDVSIGGARITATDVIPLGRCELTLEAENGPESVTAEVREVIADADAGVVIARLQFLRVPAQARARLADLTDTAAVRPQPRRWLRLALLAAGLAVAGVVAAVAASNRPASPGAVRVETADSALRIVVTDDAKDAVALSAAGQSAADDPVQVRVEAMPPQVAGQIPIVVTVENHGAKPLSFGDGLRATVQVKREAAPAARLVLSSGLKRLAPGGRISLRGTIELPQPGTYDLDVSIRVAK